MSEDQTFSTWSGLGIRSWTLDLDLDLKEEGSTRSRSGARSRTLGLSVVLVLVRSWIFQVQVGVGTVLWPVAAEKQQIYSSMCTGQDSSPAANRVSA